MKWPEDFINRLIWGDALEVTGDIPDNSIDLMPTDPPYGYSFMGRDWDKALVSIRTWKECLRVLKPGGFALIMCAPRQDVLSRQIINLEEAGFITGFSSIYWAYANGFPKAQNISKMIDKKECKRRLIQKLGRKPASEELEKAWKDFRNIIGRNAGAYRPNSIETHQRGQVANLGLKAEGSGLITAPATLQAKALDGSYGGFQPKPAVEVILVVMKPLSEKTYMEQALKNGKGMTWLDDGRIPYKSKNDEYHRISIKGSNTGFMPYPYVKRHSNLKGRFPANLLVSDDVLNDGRIRISKWGNNTRKHLNPFTPNPINDSYKKIKDASRFKNDRGSFSRYFDLDKWWEEKIKQLPEAAQRTFPFLTVSKASKSEKNRGCERLGEKVRANINKFKNHHPTIKPIKLMSYLIILGSRPNDIILDPFVGSGTTCIAAKMLARKYIGIDDVKEYVEIAQCRLGAVEPVLI